MTIKRRLHCNNPDCPHEKLLFFSEWMRFNLPDSRTGYLVTDIDRIKGDTDSVGDGEVFAVENWKTNNVMLLEVKSFSAECGVGQKMLFDKINKWIKRGVDDNWNYHGFNYIKFENSNFNDGDVFFNGKEITEDELRSILSFEKIGASNG